MREVYPQIRDLNAEVLAISTERPVDLRRTVERLGFEYPVLFDVEATVPRKYGVERHGLAVPSTFILDRLGKIHWKYVGTDVSDQASTSEPVEKLKELGQG